MIKIGFKLDCDYICIPGSDNRNSRGVGDTQCRSNILRADTPQAHCRGNPSYNRANLQSRLTKAHCCGTSS